MQYLTEVFSGEEDLICDPCAGVLRPPKPHGKRTGVLSAATSIRSAWKWRKNGSRLLDRSPPLEMEKQMEKNLTSPWQTTSHMPSVRSVNDASRFSVVSMFSGCGGSSLGYKTAGGEVLLAVDNDADAVQTYRLNFPMTPVFGGDIAELSVEECCRLAGVKPRELDILDGSPPCDGFSPLGKRQFADPRNQLFMEFVRRCVVSNHRRFSLRMWREWFGAK